MAANNRNNRQSSSLWLLLGLAVLVVLLVASLQQEQPRLQPEEPVVATDLPALKVEGWLNAQQPLSAEELRGKVVLMDCWASWCAPCRAAMPHLVVLYRQFSDQGVEVIGLTPEEGPELAQVTSYVESVSGLVWPIGYGAGPVLSSLGVKALPTLIVFDRDGRTVWSGHDVGGAEEALITALAR